MAQLPQGKLYVEGRYCKLTRDLPQTVFFCPDCKGHPRRRKKCERCEGFGKLTRDSVQELVAWVLGKALGTRKNKFHGAGREDVDVRMLGEGRPFVLEFINPKTPDVDLAALEEEINRRNDGRLVIKGLHWSDKNRIRVVKETQHAKQYSALIAVEGGAKEEDFAPFLEQRITLEQSTPRRVAHRRAEKVRERWIEFEGVEATEDPERWHLRMRTQHGTYVKEAITGEDGATKPSLSELIGRSCQCLELDVLGILDEEGAEIPIRKREAIGFGDGL